MADPVADANSYEEAVEKAKNVIGDRTDVTAVYHVDKTNVIVYRNEGGDYEISVVTFTDLYHSKVLSVNGNSKIRGEFIYTSSYE